MAQDLLAEPKKLNRVVIKEELVALTGDFKLAIVLNQMIYWSERRADADKFISEEIERLKRQKTSSDDIVSIQPAHGWIYKKAEELVAETMIGSSAKTMLRYLNTLVEKGWLQKRKNPRYDFDRTYQYRVDLIRIQTDLLALGYSLEGYDLGITNLQNANTNLQKVNCIESGTVDTDLIETPILTYLPFDNTNCQNVRAIPETTNTKEEEEEGLPVEEFSCKSKNEIAAADEKEILEDESDLKEKDLQEEINEFSKYTAIEMSGNAARDTYLKWRFKWGFSHEMIMKAGQVMSQLAKVPNLAYTDRILSDWMKRRIRSVPEVERLLELFRANPVETLRPKSNKPKTNFSDEYDLYVPPDI